MSSKETRVGKRVLLTGKKGKKKDRQSLRQNSKYMLSLWLEKNIRVGTEI